MVEVKQQSRKKKFIKDFGVYSVGVLGSRLIAFLMVIFYAFFIEPDELGYYDICLHTCLLLSPLVTLQLRDGAFRHLIISTDENERKKIITFSINTLWISIIIIIVTSIFIHIIRPIPYLTLITFMLILMAMCDIILHIVRGLGNNKAFVSSNLICTFCTALLSIFLVAVVHWGIMGIFIANTLSRVPALIYAEYKEKVFSRYYSKSIDTKAIKKELIRYCLPLIPVAVCWWMTSAVNRYFVMGFLGSEMTGIYAVATKLASILQILGIVFYQTWQENAIQQYQSKDRDTFFSKVFNSYITVLSFMLIFYVFGLKIFYGILPIKYQGGAEYLYLMGVSTLFYTMTTYFDLGYQCAKETKRAVKSIFFTAAINVILNLSLTKLFGIYGILASSISAYIFLLIYRFIDTKRYFTISVNRATIIHFSLVVIGAVVYMKKIPWWGDLTFIAFCLIVLFKTIPVRNITNFITKKIGHRMGPG